MEQECAELRNVEVNFVWISVSKAVKLLYYDVKVLSGVKRENSIENIVPFIFASR
jgi:hypothetical protein